MATRHGTPNRNGRVYTKQALDNMISNMNPKKALYDMHVVPKELATKIEVELDDGFVLAKTDNIISTTHRFGHGYLLKKIEEQRPDIMCAMDSTFIDEVDLGSMVYERDNPYVPDVQDQNICYTCPPCTS